MPQGQNHCVPPSRCPQASHASFSRFIFPTTRLGGESQFSDFLDGLGPAQIVGRQTLATPPMGESSQGQGEWGNSSHAAGRVSSAGALRDAMQAAERGPRSGFCASEEESVCTLLNPSRNREERVPAFLRQPPCSSFSSTFPPSHHHTLTHSLAAYCVPSCAKCQA